MIYLSGTLYDVLNNTIVYLFNNKY